MNICRFTDMLDRIAFPKDVQSKKSLAVGLALRFLETKSGAKQVGLQLNRILPSIEANQYDFYFDSIGRTVGFVTWALVDSEMANNLVQTGPLSLPQSEWQSGNDLWIIDFFALHGILPDVLTELRDRTFSAHDLITYIRYKGTMRIVKQLSRRDKTTFFCEPLKDFESEKINLTTGGKFLHAVEAKFSGAVEIGRCALALQNAETYVEAPLWKSSYWLREVIAIRQYRTYLSSDNTPSGLLTWAWLSERTISRIAHVPLHDTHTSEWNEGDLFCLCDVAVSETVRDEMEGDILRNLFPQELTILLYLPAINDAPPQLVKVKRAQQSEVIKEWLVRASTYPAINKPLYAVSA